MMKAQCPLCQSVETRVLHVKPRTQEAYNRCCECYLIFLDPQFLLSPEEERLRYLLHDNDIADPRYRQFLAPLSNAIAERLPKHSRGLDYGCGPGPLLAQMLEEAQFSMSIYDPQFYPDESTLSHTYEFVTGSEVAEHFHNPRAEFERLSRMLRPGGWLGIMTETIEDEERFAGWHYHRDPTHVVFYGQRSFECIREKFGFEVLERPTERLALFKKKSL